MFQDESSFGRITQVLKCWAKKGARPQILYHQIREFRYLFGAVDPKSGDSSFRIISSCDTVCMNAFLKDLSLDFKNEHILLVCDNASWHKSKTLEIPNNITITHILPYTPEMNPIEQLWKEIKEKHFANLVFPSLKRVEDKICYAIQNLSKSTIKNITNRSWIC